MVGVGLLSRPWATLNSVQNCCTFMHVQKIIFELYVCIVHTHNVYKKTKESGGVYLFAHLSGQVIVLDR